MTRLTQAVWNHLQIAIIFLILAAITLTGCSVLDERSKSRSAPDTEGNKPKIGLITGEGGIDDPYYKNAWEGVQKAEQEFAVGIVYAEAKDDKDIAARLQELKAQDCELIFTIGANSVTAVLAEAGKNSGVKYVCLDGVPTDSLPANMSVITYKVEEASYLAGYLAGKMTETNVAGYISGDNSDRSLRYFYGYKAGLRAANSGCELLKGIAATYTNTTRVEGMTKRMLDSDADIVFQTAGIAGKGVISEMEQAGHYAIGSDADQNYLAPKNVLTSVVKNNDVIIKDLIQKYKENRLELGENLEYGLTENAVGLAGTTKATVPEAVYNQIMQYQEKIIAGKIIVPAKEN